MRVTGRVKYSSPATRFWPKVREHGVSEGREAGRGYSYLRMSECLYPLSAFSDSSAAQMGNADIVHTLYVSADELKNVRGRSILVGKCSDGRSFQPQFPPRLYPIAILPLFGP
jgi:hypothetical protein